MRPRRGIFSLALLLLVLSISTSAAKASKPTVVESEAATSDPRLEEDDDGFIEKNPGYVSDGDSDSDDEYDSDDEDEPLEPKAAMNSALGKQQKKKRDKLPTKVVKFVKTHRLQITIALAVIAFRREIGKFLMNKLAPVDPETGKMRLKLDPTQILKIIVFIDILRQFQAASKNKNNNGQRGADPLLIALLLLGAKNPIFSSLITKTILQENSSFVPPIEQHYTFERINDRYEKDGWALQKAAQHSPNSNKKKQQGGGNDALNMLYNLRDRDGKKKKKFYDETVIVLDLQRLNDTPGRIDMLRDEVSFLLHQHEQKIIPYNDNLEEEEDNNDDDENEDRELEIVVLLESPGGVASDFALASQQLLRLRQAKGIRVTVCVDRVAASGGYMVACASSPGRLYAAPFAVVGSIGVIGQAINVQKLLEGWGIQGMVFKAGKEKAPGGLIGEVTKRDKKSIQSIVDETHAAFKRHVANARPKLARTIEDVATGKIWLGYDALEEGLIDRIVTSDEYIRERINDGARVLKLTKNTRKRLFGGPPQQQGALDSRILSLKTEAKRALQYLAERINIPLGSAGGEDLEGDLSPLTSTRLPHHSAKVDARSSTSPQ